MSTSFSIPLLAVAAASVAICITVSIALCRQCCRYSRRNGWGTEDGESSVPLTTKGEDGNTKGNVPAPINLNNIVVAEPLRGPHLHPSAPSSHRSNLPALRLLRERAKDYLIDYKEITFGRLLGSGSQGEVFMARWRGLDVAVKKVDTSKVDEDIIEEFCSEATIMRRMRHPSLTLFMGISLDEPHLCIITELVHRGALFDLLQDETVPLTWRRRLYMAIDIAKGLNYLHQHKPPIIHRDLKSLNILVDSNYRAKVADFGMTRFKSSTAEVMTQCGCLEESMEILTSDGTPIRVGDVGTDPSNWPILMNEDGQPQRIINVNESFSHNMYEIAENNGFSSIHHYIVTPNHDLVFRWMGSPRGGFDNNSTYYFITYFDSSLDAHTIIVPFIQSRGLYMSSSVMEELAIGKAIFPPVQNRAAAKEMAWRIFTELGHAERALPFDSIIKVAAEKAFRLPVSIRILLRPLHIHSPPPKSTSSLRQLRKSFQFIHPDGETLTGTSISVDSILVEALITSSEHVLFEVSKFFPLDIRKSLVVASEIPSSNDLNLNHYLDIVLNQHKSAHIVGFGKESSSHWKNNFHLLSSYRVFDVVISNYVCGNHSFVYYNVQNSQRASLASLYRSIQLAWNRQQESSSCGYSGLLPRGLRLLILKQSQVEINVRNIHRKMRYVGISVDDDRHNVVLKSGTVTGNSPLWMSPEVIRNVEYDEKSDVYSFGICLWELYTKKIPYRDLGLHPSKLVIKVVKESLRPVVPLQCPARVHKLMTACWHPIATTRPAFDVILKELEKCALDVNIINQGEGKGQKIEIGDSDATDKPSDDEAVSPSPTVSNWRVDLHEVLMPMPPAVSMSSFDSSSSSSSNLETPNALSPDYPRSVRDAILKSLDWQINRNCHTNSSVINNLWMWKLAEDGTAAIGSVDIHLQTFISSQSNSTDVVWTLMAQRQADAERMEREKGMMKTKATDAQKTRVAVSRQRRGSIGAFAPITPTSKPPEVHVRRHSSTSTDDVEVELPPPPPSWTLEDEKKLLLAGGKIPSPPPPPPRTLADNEEVKERKSDSKKGSVPQISTDGSNSSQIILAEDNIRNDIDFQHHFVAFFTRFLLRHRPSVTSVSIASFRSKLVLVKQFYIEKALIQISNEEKISADLIHRIPNSHFTAMMTFLSQVRHPNLVLFMGAATAPMESVAEDGTKLKKMMKAKPKLRISTLKPNAAGSLLELAKSKEAKEKDKEREAKESKQEESAVILPSFDDPLLRLRSIPIVLIEEFLARGSLLSLLEDPHTTLSWDSQIQILIDLAQGLLFLHETHHEGIYGPGEPNSGHAQKLARTRSGGGINTGIIHYDLSPARLMVDSSWRVKIADWGFVDLPQTLKFRQLYGEAQKEKKEKKESSAKRGDPFVRPTWYHPPELIQMSADFEKSLSGSADRNAVGIPLSAFSVEANVYSFGVIAWHVLTRRRPFQREVRRIKVVKAGGGTKSSADVDDTDDHEDGKDDGFFPWETASLSPFSSLFSSSSPSPTVSSPSASSSSFRLQCPPSFGPSLSSLVDQCCNPNPKKRFHSMSEILSRLVSIRGEGPPLLVLTAKNAHRYRKRQTVFAFHTSDPLMVHKVWGENRAKGGDVVIFSGCSPTDVKSQGHEGADVYSCSKEVFMSTYHPVVEGRALTDDRWSHEYRKVGTILAKQMEYAFAVQMGDGNIENGQKGDFLVQHEHNENEQWIIEQKSFTQLYEKV